MYDERLLAMARNVRAGLLRATDYDDEVATIYNALRWARELPADQPAPTETGPLSPNEWAQKRKQQLEAEPAPQGAPLCSSAEPNELATEGHFFTGGRCKWCDVRMLEASNRCNLTAVREVVK